MSRLEGQLERQTIGTLPVDLLKRLRTALMTALLPPEVPDARHGRRAGPPDARPGAGRALHAAADPLAGGRHGRVAREKTPLTQNALKFTIEYQNAL